MDAKALRDLAIRAAEDPETLATLDENQVTEMRKALNPAGGIVQAKASYANMSIINFSERSRRNFLMMSLIGFLYRLANEYEPDVSEINEKWEAEINKAKGATRIELVKARDAEIADWTRRQRVWVKRFLDRNFEHDPDMHVRKAKTNGKFEDKEREAVMRKVAENVRDERLAEATARLAAPGAFESLKNVTMKAHHEMKAASESVAACIRAIAHPDNSTQDKIAVLVRRGANLKALTANLATIAEPIAAAGTIEALRVQPPVDVFHQFSRYMDNHYEALNDLCLAFFNEKPDLEEAVTLYSVHDNEEDARDFCKQHRDEFRTQVITVSTGGCTILGPYTANRERLNYYNKNTEVLKMLAEQNEMDAKLGEDILKKRVERKKKQNIRETGPDPKALAAYRTSGIMGDAHGQGGHVSEDGAFKGVPHDKMKEMAAEIEAEKKAAEAKRTAADAARSAPTSADSAPPLTSAASAAASMDDREARRAAMQNVPEDQRPRVTELAKRTHMFNVEAVFKEREPVDDYDKARMAGTYRVNDTSDAELPDNAVMMDMFIPQTDDEGNTKLVRRDFYTKAEPPLHLEKDSPYQAQYQPVSDDGTGRPLLKEKVVVDASGRKSIVHVHSASPDPST